MSKYLGHTYGFVQNLVDNIMLTEQFYSSKSYWKNSSQDVQLTLRRMKINLGPDAQPPSVAGKG